MRRMRPRAFTLVELLIVIIVIAVLAAIAIPKIGDRWRYASEQRWKVQLNLRRKAIERFRADTGLWPTTRNAVANTTAPATGLDDLGNTVPIPPSTWNGPYLMMRESNNETTLHPYVAGIGYDYTTTAPGVGTLRLNTSKRALDGSNMGTW